MSYVIYGLRLKGSPEVRYVGLTSFTPEIRLLHLTREARLYGQRPTTGRSGWLLVNKGQIDAFEIARADTKADAHKKEREAVQFCLLLNHRLFNAWLVPAGRRLDWKPSRFYTRLRRAAQGLAA